MPYRHVPFCSAAIIVAVRLMGTVKSIGAPSGIARNHSFTVEATLHASDKTPPVKGQLKPGVHIFELKPNLAAVVYLAATLPPKDLDHVVLLQEQSGSGMY
jgi:hypothetical protein